MTWIFLAAGLVAAGLVVLLVAGTRVARAARTLNSEIAQVHALFNAKSDVRG
ncbi:hypothetical protein [Nonomuraea rhodomycinica]|uniref:Uncharacterized protein n=1 Tax=Nonomuraea rhodomycinica TaxID=1712872 RepID=A0A7Y6IP09_9ACTN|nr:hypothetical protein [Nonomuraea rhodomycinica]NUW41774.1 hypothetical protein [Nonomuraea rhodomycinica]